MARSAGGPTDQCFRICQTTDVSHSRHGLSIGHLLAGTGLAGDQTPFWIAGCGYSLCLPESWIVFRYSPWYEQTANVHDCLRGYSLIVR